MLLHEQPFKFIFKIFRIFGFLTREISLRRKIISLLTFIGFPVIMTLLASASLLQSKSMQHVLDRSFSVASTVSMVLKSTVILIKMDKIMDLVSQINELSKIPRFANHLKSATKRAYKLTIFYFTLETLTLISTASGSLLQRYFMKPLLTFEFMKRSEMYVTVWTYFTIGGFYFGYLLTVIDLLPLVIMTSLPMALDALNEEIQGIDMSKKDGRTNLLNVIKTHRKIIR